MEAGLVFRADAELTGEAVSVPVALLELWDEHDGDGVVVVIVIDGDDAEDEAVWGAGGVAALACRWRGVLLFLVSCDARRS